MTLSKTAKTSVTFLALWLSSGTIFWLIIGKGLTSPTIISLAYGLGLMVGLMGVVFIALRSKTRTRTYKPQSQYTSTGM